MESDPRKKSRILNIFIMGVPYIRRRRIRRPERRGGTRVSADKPGTASADRSRTGTMV